MRCVTLASTWVAKILHMAQFKLFWTFPQQEEAEPAIGYKAVQPSGAIDAKAEDF